MAQLHHWTKGNKLSQIPRYYFVLECQGDEHDGSSLRMADVIYFVHFGEFVDVFENCGQIVESNFL